VTIFVSMYTSQFPN